MVSASNVLEKEAAQLFAKFLPLSENFLRYESVTPVDRIGVCVLSWIDE